MYVRMYVCMYVCMYVRTYVRRYAFWEKINKTVKKVKVSKSKKFYYTVYSLQYTHMDVQKIQAVQFYLISRKVETRFI